ncbi:MAG: VOC family protein [Gammaproteobacteria bacterium]|nr:VOC family protein [Gammaproteobacteria bacterium]
MTFHLEHINLTVEDPKRTAAKLCQLLNWRIRWQGASLNEGYTVHVGDDHHYIALYAQPSKIPMTGDTYQTPAAVNHIGIETNDLDEFRQHLSDLDITITAQNQTPPGQRLYLFVDEIELEILQY